MIRREIDEKLDLTRFVCSGLVTAGEIEDELRILYEGIPSLNAMWDYTVADVSALSPEDISGIAKFVAKASHSRAGGKTALVFSTAMLVEMAPLLESIAEIKVPDAKIKIFSDVETGLAWIGS